MKMMSRGWFCALLLFLMNPPQGRAEFEWQGSATGFVSNQKNAGIELQFDSRYRFNSVWSFQFAPWARSDGATPYDSEKNQFDINELNLGLEGKWGQLRAGISRLTWEGTDVLNPMDVIHAKNWRDPFEIKTRGSAGLFYSTQVNAFSFDAVFIPKQTEMLLPDKDSPWWPRKFAIPIQTDEYILRLPDEMDYVIDEPVELNDALKNNGGLRLQYLGESFDIALAGFEGSASPPILLPTQLSFTAIEIYPRTVLLLKSPLHIQPLYFRQRVLATNTTWTVSSWIFRFAGQHVQPLGDDPRLSRWSQYGVVAIEKPILIGSHEPIFLLQGASVKKAETGGLSMLSNLLDSSLMAGVRWALSDTCVWTSAFFQEQTEYSSFFHNELTWTFKESWQTQLVSDQLQGKAGTVLGTYQDNSRLQFKLIRLF